jgi:4-amino-4-deoxy-L-arabinose transferase-like glycosyltransferase
VTASTLHFDLPSVADTPPPQRSRRRSRERLSLVALLVGTAVLYLWNLGANGYGNDFYAAAVQAGTKSWKAFFFGSFDSSNAITVDKPPASLWPMEIAGRVFGFGSWSMLVPQAIEGVLAVWLVHATVKRVAGHWAGILAGALLAITPVAALMFRFNNPDALMTLLIVLAAYCTTRALELASTRWLLLAGLSMGFGFLAKGLQPFTVLPALAIAYLVAAPTPLRRRVLQLLAAGLAVVVGAGWWVLAVQLTPAADRPYIGGSGDNSPLGLAFGYNGLSRLSGDTGGGGGGGGGFDGTTGIGRMFNSLNGGQIAWLLPTALLAVVALAVITRRAPRIDGVRAAAIIWGGWLLVTAGVLSFASGIIHTYYTVELAPAIAALVAVGTVVLWRHREQTIARVGLAVGSAVTGIWGYALLHRTPSFQPWLGYLLVVAGLAVGAMLLAPPATLRRAAVVITTVGGLVVLAGGSAAYALDTVTTAHTGSTPSAGPTVSSGFGGPGGAGGRPGSFGGGGFGGSRPEGMPTGGGAPTGGASTGGASTGGASTGGAPTGGAPTGSAPTGMRGGFGGGSGTTSNSALTALLKKTTTRWAAATIGSQSAGPLELASGKAVMAIGGFSGTDASPTLAQFEAYVKAGKIAYFIGSGQGGGFGARGGSGTGSAISQWVAAHYTATTVGGQTVYDLTKAAS